MKGILLLNGQPYGGEIDTENAYVICCDGAYDWAEGKVKIDENVGDFDSLDRIPNPPPTQIYPSEKNFTDGEIALFKLIERGVSEVEIYGGEGGREDHFLGNLHLLYHAHKRGVRAKMFTANGVIFPASGRAELKGIAGKTFSLLPFGGTVHILGSTGLKYPEPPEIGYGECIGISNVAAADRAVIEIAEGDCALIIINERAV